MIETAERANALPRQVASRPIAVTHVITSLATGGAEMMLLKLLSATDRSRFRSSVIALSGDGPVASRLRGIGVPVKLLELTPAQVLRGALELGVELRSQKPDLVQTWMYHADLLGSVASVAVRRVPLVWNIRCGRLDREIDKRTTIWASRACALGSGAVPKRILCCSQASLEAHAAAGYARTKMQVVPNGFDTDEFRPQPQYRRAVREELGLGPDDLLGGLIARFNGAKDHVTFCGAAHIACHADPRIHFVLCGDGVTPANPELKALAGDRCHLLGRCDDIPAIMAALDFAISSSAIEGFPNVIGEAMSCAVPCVATDAGDSRVIIGDTGLVVPTRNAPALAAGILEMVRMGSEARAQLGQRARRRIIEHFSLAAAVRQYESVYEELATRCAG